MFTGNDCLTLMRVCVWLAGHLATKTQMDLEDGVHKALGHRMNVPQPLLLVEILMPNVEVSGGEAFGRGFRHQGGAS